MKTIDIFIKFDGKLKSEFSFEHVVKHPYESDHDMSIAFVAYKLLGYNNYFLGNIML